MFHHSSDFARLEALCPVGDTNVGDEEVKVVFAPPYARTVEAARSRVEIGVHPWAIDREV